jgi:hypothetical protein
MSTETKPPITPANIRALAGYYQRRADFKDDVAVTPDNATPETFATIALALRLLACMQTSINSNGDTRFTISMLREYGKAVTMNGGMARAFKEAIRLVTPDEAEGV